MKKTTWHTLLRITGIIIMLPAFVVFSDPYPWYVPVLVFDLGLLLCLLPKWSKKVNWPLNLFRSNS